jgi:hypothetical protein
MEANIGLFVVIYLAIIVFYAICGWKIYEKAGKPGWAAIIPIYNIIVMLEIVGKPWWWFFLFLIPIVNLVFAIMMLHQLSLSFGKDSGFTLGLLFLGFIFYPILAFGDSKYEGPGGTPVAVMQESY